MPYVIHEHLKSDISASQMIHIEDIASTYAIKGNRIKTGGFNLFFRMVFCLFAKYLKNAMKRYGKKESVIGLHFIEK
jgi:hypothetical protein